MELANDVRENHLNLWADKRMFQHLIRNDENAHFLRLSKTVSNWTLIVLENASWTYIFVHLDNFIVQDTIGKVTEKGPGKTEETHYSGRALLFTCQMQIACSLLILKKQAKLRFAKGDIDLMESLMFHYRWRYHPYHPNPLCLNRRNKDRIKKHMDIKLEINLQRTVSIKS